MNETRSPQRVSFLFPGIFAVRLALVERYNRLGATARSGLSMQRLTENGVSPL